MTKEDKRNIEFEDTSTDDSSDTNNNSNANSTDDQADTSGDDNHLSTEERLSIEVAEQKEKFIRLYSEFENFRRRTAKERLDLISSASEKLIADLLPVLDDFERAIATNENVEDSNALKEGFGLLYQKFNAVLKSKGLTEIDALEKEFDVDFHEAITKIPAPSPDLKNKVIDVVEKGYTINDKVLRYSKVVVGE